MKTLYGFLFLLLAGSNTLSAQCLTVIDVSTGYNQQTGSAISPTALDDDWVLTQVPTGVSAFTGTPGWVINKDPGWDLAGTNSQYLNYTNNSNGVNNWCSGDLPIIYQNPFCVCGLPEEVALIEFDLAINCDNYAEVWLMDGAGNPMQMLVAQPHMEVVSNFRNPAHTYKQTHALTVGHYSLALLQRNRSAITGVNLSGTLTYIPSAGDGIQYGSVCGAFPALSGPLYGSTLSCSGSGNNGNNGGSGCPASLDASTGYDEDLTSQIADNQRDDDWILTQVPSGTSSANVGSKAYVIPKHASYHWAGANAKYINYQNSGSGPDNWYNHHLPFVYQYGFCICGDPALPMNVSFDLELHADNWSEVWLMDANGNSIQRLLTQNHVQHTDNFKDPEDANVVPVTINPGSYSLALLQRNGTGPTAVSLDVVITSPDGVVQGEECAFTPTLNGNFHGSQVTASGGGGGPIPCPLPPCDPTSTDPGDGPGGPGPWLKTAVDQGASDLMLFPNPADETITLSGFGANTHLILKDLQGRIVRDEQTSGNRPIDISQLPAGVYLLQASDEDGNRLVEKLVVE